MNYRWFLGVALSLAGSLAMADGHGQNAAKGDPEAGKALAVACGACHGADGATPTLPEYPHLAGQNEKYLFNQLTMIKAKTREIALMAGQLDTRSEQDLRDLAAYYASLPAKNGVASGDDEALARGEAIYRGGILSKKVAACTSCHSPNAGGNALAGYPRIAGQPVAYTVAQLKAYREGARQSDEAYGGMMRGVASRLTDTEINLVADYISGLY